MPRMTNTYMLDGKFKKEEILSTVKNGIYAANFGGGQVDIVSGKFVFSASEAYKIENGKLSYPVKGATLIGNGPDILKTVSMIGDDSKLDSGVGTCGKDGQSVPVGVGQPSLKIDAITVGGTVCKKVLIIILSFFSSITFSQDRFITLGPHILNIFNELNSINNVVAASEPFDQRNS